MTKSINYMKLTMSLGMIVFVAALVMGATGAFFNDTETSTGNTFTAGALDLTIDSVQHYNDMVCAEIGADTGVYAWVPEDGGFTLDDDNHAVTTEAFDEQAEWEAFNDLNPTQYPQAGVTCTGSWRLADDNGDAPVIGQFWNFDDIKPGDEGENTISIHINNNDAWLCAAIDSIVDEDNDITEPEAEDPGEDSADGDLDEHLEFFAWVDEGETAGFQGDDQGEGDNIFQDGETVLGSASAEELSEQVWALAEGGDEPIAGGDTGYIGLAWCAGSFDDGGNCDGSTMGNEAQTDTWGVDFLFYVEQARNNSDFSCSEVDLLTPLQTIVAPTT